MQQLLCKDFRALTDEDIPSESIDVILTDPPYNKAAVPLFGDLGALAARVLKPHGSLVVLCGQMYLPDYLHHLARHLTYVWMLAYRMPGGQASTIWQRNKMNSFWKPVLWFVKGDDVTCDLSSDVIRTRANSNEKQFHRWGQSENGMRLLLERFSQRGDVILDPMLGGGTTGCVAVALGRSFVGVEADPAAYAIACQRLAAPLQLEFGVP